MDSTTYLNRYRLTPGANGTPVALQRGPGGVTYQAEDIQTGRVVALKLVPSYSFEPAELEQLEAEARAAQLVNHPNVARLFDFGFAGDDVVFVTEMLDGSTLNAWVGEHGPLPAAAVVRVALQVVSGLAAAAFHSVVHRSIQPATLMIVPGQTPDGEWPFVKVLNFGGVPPALSASEFSFGRAGSSADFASPEQLKGYPVDFRSELYSLGGTMWYLLTGAPPVPGTTDKANRIPKALRPMLAQMVALDPMQRPQDPVLLQDQLRDCLAVIERREATARKFGMPVAAPVTRASGEARNTMALLKPVALAAAILLLIGVAALALPHILRSRSTAAEPLGVPVGVPEASAAPRATPALAANAPERTPGETDQVVPTSTAAPESSSVAEASLFPADNSAQTLVSVPSPGPNISAESSASAKETAPAVAESRPEPTVIAANSTPKTADSIDAPVPEEPKPRTAATSPLTGQQITQAPAERPETDRSASTTAPKTTTLRKVPAGEPSSTPTKRPPVAKAMPRRAEPVRRDEVRPAEPVDESDLVNAPPVPRGTKRARYLGTTPEGDLVFGLPSNERGFVAPPANQGDQPRRRRARRVAPEPTPQREMILPAEPVDPEDE